MIEDRDLLPRFRHGRHVDVGHDDGYARTPEVEFSMPSPPLRPLVDRRFGPALWSDDVSSVVSINVTEPYSVPGQIAG